MINLNNEILFVGKFKCGKTQNIECRLGHNLYLIDIDKNSDCTTLDFYKKANSSREFFSKYDAQSELVSLTIQNEALLDRNFFENIKEIANAQKIVERHSQKLCMHL